MRGLLGKPALTWSILLLSDEPPPPVPVSLLAAAPAAVGSSLVPPPPATCGLSPSAGDGVDGDAEPAVGAAVAGDSRLIAANFASSAAILAFVELVARGECAQNSGLSGVSEQRPE